MRLAVLLTPADIDGVTGSPALGKGRGEGNCINELCKIKKSPVLNSVSLNASS